MVTRYRIITDDMSRSFEFISDGAPRRNPPDDETVYPDWVQLGFHQCPHCPLSTYENAVCPAAASMVEVLNRFQDCNSYDEVTLHVDRELESHSLMTDLQRALAYLYPAIFAQSACPYAPLLRPVIRFSRTFPDMDDILFLSLASDIIWEQYGSRNRPPVANSAGLAEPSQTVSVVFHGLLSRFRGAATGDANINGLIKDIQWAHADLYSRETILGRLEPYFLTDGVDE